jgi:hypothetical protein
MLGDSLISKGNNECVAGKAEPSSEEMDPESGDWGTSGVPRADDAASLPSSSLRGRLESERGGGDEPTEDSARFEETEQSGVELESAEGLITLLVFELLSDDDGDEEDAIGVSALNSRPVGEDEEGA